MSVSMMNFGGQNGTDLAVVLDGGDYTTTLSMSITQADFDTTGGNVFSLSGTALTATAADINSVVNTNTFVSTAPVVIPSLASDPSVLDASIYYNTTIPAFRVCVNGAWATLATV